MNRLIRGAGGTAFCLCLLLSACAGRETGSDSSVHASNALSSAGAMQTGQIPEPQDELSARAGDILAGMTADEKVGQLFLARCPATGGAETVQRYKLGGLVLFGRDFDGKPPKAASEDIAGYQRAANTPLLIAVDEEGGTVNRVSRIPAFRGTPFLSPQTLYKQGGFDRIREDTAEKSKLLKGLGINLNLAPVCDVSQSKSDYMYARSFGKDAEQTARYVRAVVEEMSRQRMGSALKHFPGYGNNADTHTGIARDKRSLKTFRDSDFLPFRAGIGAGAGAVLVSHNIVECMDAGRPASLSPAVHQILRNELSFDGVVITDDLVMNGIRDYTGDEAAAVKAVLAGNDLICCTDYETQVPAVRRAVQSGEIPLSRVEESVLRILRWKLALGIIE